MGGIEIGSLALAGLAVFLAAYVWFVSRRHQVYRRERIYAAPQSAIWQLSDITPENDDWVPHLASCTWVDHAAGDMAFIYVNGAELRHRVVERQPERFILTESRIRTGPDAPWGDMMRTSTWLDPLVDGRTHARVEIVIEREPGLSTLSSRLGYPLMLPFAQRQVTRRLVEVGALTETARPRGLRVLWQIAIVLATLVSMIWLTSFWAGIGLIVMLVAHEYGHVWSMRRNGHETARFHLVPFFGGVAIGSRAFQSEREAVEIFLMGPVFGLATSLASLGVFWLTDDPFFASLAAFLAIVNGLNLAPAPPLDGGRITQSLLRPLGDRGWYLGSGLLILTGAAVAVYFRLAGMVVVALLGAWAWSTTRGPDPRTRPLSAGGWFVSLAAYVGLAFLHVVVTIWAFELAGFDALDMGPAIFRADDPLADS